LPCESRGKEEKEDGAAWKKKKEFSFGGEVLNINGGRDYFRTDRERLNTGAVRGRLKSLSATILKEKRKKFTPFYREGVDLGLKP